jgi:hypothetical protein
LAGKFRKGRRIAFSSLGENVGDAALLGELPAHDLLKDAIFAYGEVRGQDLSNASVAKTRLDRRMPTSFGILEPRSPPHSGLKRNPPLVRQEIFSATAGIAAVSTNRDGNMHGPSSRIFQEVLHRVLDKAGFPEVERNGKRRRYIVFHSLRHTFASHWVMRSGDIFKVQRILGHQSIAMTQRYAHLAPDAFPSRATSCVRAPRYVFRVPRQDPERLTRLRREQ